MSIEGSFLARISRGISKNSRPAAGGNFGAKKKASIFIEAFRLVARPGFEPRQTAPKTVVLPLYYRAILLCFVARLFPFDDANIRRVFYSANKKYV